MAESWEDRLDALDVQVARLQEQRVADRDALRLQAREYKRRLKGLNHAQIKSDAFAATYVTVDKYDDKMKSETEAREIALERVNEKFGDFITRYEARQREVDQKLAIMEGASAQAQRVVKDQAYKTNRNLAVAVLIITAVSVLANYLGAI